MSLPATELKVTLDENNAYFDQLKENKALWTLSLLLTLKLNTILVLKGYGTYNHDLY